MAWESSLKMIMDATPAGIVVFSGEAVLLFAAESEQYLEFKARVN